jgi:protein-S-isoprenylcysteine O-methyltransferase Ste14
MNRIAALGYATASYLFFFVTFIYSIGWIGNLFVPSSIDVGASDASFAEALLINLVLLSVFAVQHSVMARPAFKRWWTRFVPQPVERATYVLFSTLALVALYAWWQPMTGVVWEIESEAGRAVMQGVYLFGWGLLLYATFILDHFGLFGVRQAVMHWNGESHEKELFVTPSLYRFVRHPIYVAWLVIFWAAPTMTVGHALFTAMTTAYILVAIQLEERDLIDQFGETYVSYKQTTPALVPIPARREIRPRRTASA